MRQLHRKITETCCSVRAQLVGIQTVMPFVALPPLWTRVGSDSYICGPQPRPQQPLLVSTPSSRLRGRHALCHRQCVLHRCYYLGRLLGTYCPWRLSRLRIWPWIKYASDANPSRFWTMTTRPSNNNQGSNKAGNGNPHAGRQNSRPDNHSPQPVSQSLQTGHTGAPISMQPSSRSAQMKDNAGPGQPLVLDIPASG